MSFVWEFSTEGGTIFEGRMACWPVVPGSVIITCNDGVNPKTMIDNGDGTMSGDGLGVIDYDYGYVNIEFSLPFPVTGTDVKADYTPVEGGCSDDCGKCASNYIRLDITPGSISGSDSYTIADAWTRLFQKIRRDIMPIHVEILYLLFSESYELSIGHRFDDIPADEETVDSGLRPLFDDASW